MLETIIVVLIILWALGFFVTPVAAVAGNLIHVLLVVILIVVVLRVLQGRRPLS